MRYERAKNTVPLGLWIGILLKKSPYVLCRARATRFSGHSDTERYEAHVVLLAEFQRGDAELLLVEESSVCLRRDYDGRWAWVSPGVED